MAEIVAASAVSEAGVSKRVALKRIRSESAADPVFVARFFDEVRLAMQLSHANVVQVFDFGRTESHEFFLAMEFVEGRRRAAAAAQPRLRAPAAGRGAAHRRRHAARPRLRAPAHQSRQSPAGHRPPGRQAGERAAVVRGRGEADRLRRRALARRAPPDGRHQRHHPVHVARAGARRAASIRARTCSRPACCCTRCSAASARSARRTPSARWSRCACATTSRPCRLERFQRFDALLRRALDPDPAHRFPSAGAFADAIEELMFTQGWRGGAAALRERVRARSRASASA